MVYLIIMAGLLSFGNSYCNALYWTRVPYLDGMNFMGEGMTMNVKRIACAKLCTEISKCVSFSYDEQNVKCQLFQEIFTVGTSVSNLYTKYYISSRELEVDTSYCTDADGYLFHSGICFRPYDTDVSWLTSQQICWADGGDLLVIDSSQKNDIVTSVLDPTQSYYMGINHIYAGENFEVVDGRTPEDLGYRNWFTGAVSNIGSDLCGVLQTDITNTGTFYWYAESCIGNPNFICEIKAP